MKTPSTSESTTGTIKLNPMVLEYLKARVNGLKLCTSPAQVNQKAEHINFILGQIKLEPRVQSTPIPQFLVDSGIDKAIQNTIKEIQMFKGMGLLVMQEYIKTIDLHILHHLQCLVKQQIALDPEYMKDFEDKTEVVVRNFLRSEAVKKVDRDLAEQFEWI